MALIKCHECGTGVSTEAKTCPNCGATPRTASNKLMAIGTALFILIVALFFFGGGLEKQTAKDLDKIETQVADDAVRQYNIAKQNGGNMDACIQAGIVSGAFLQAKNQDRYQFWKQIEKTDCIKAGVPIE